MTKKRVKNYCRKIGISYGYKMRPGRFEEIRLFMQTHEELLQIAERLAAHAVLGSETKITEPIQALINAVNRIGKASSGSWVGYHANVYYDGLNPPPPGAYFSQEWGLEGISSLDWGSKGDWYEYDPDNVKDAIYEAAGNPDLKPVRQLAEKSRILFEEAESEILSILVSEISSSPDGFIESIRDEVRELEFLDRHEILNRRAPKRKLIIRDVRAANQGSKAPPHERVRAEIVELHNSIALVSELEKLARKAGSHLARKQRQHRKTGMVGTNIFIGHGRSLVWRELKDFIKDSLALPYDEFNRVPVAGVTNIARLSEMLDAAAIAFIILTGEDEQADTKLHARMNAVHEAGLFQGRLGFNRAIILLEYDCEEFSNIQGLGQIRFPKGNIKAAFEEIRQVLEREGIIN
jgi:predicted nucleotide-binding protein